MMHRSTFALALAFVAGALTIASTALATPPALLSVQGALRNEAGGPASDGKYPMTFQLYASATETQALLTEIQVAVDVKNATFATTLGGKDPDKLLAALIGKSEVWLGLTISDNPEMPRVPVLSVAYAIDATHAASADNADNATTADLATLAKSAEALTKPITGDLIAPGSLGASAIGFTYAGSSTKGGPATGLECTGCITLTHLDPSVLVTDNVTYAPFGGAAGALTPWLDATGKSVAGQGTAIAALQAVFQVSGKTAGVGKAPAAGCTLDVSSDSGGLCIDGAPAMTVRIVADAGGLGALAQEGQIVYRKDVPGLFVYQTGAWRKLSLAPWCGDGVKEGAEECDNGKNNADAPDKCRVSCLNPKCGDKIADTGEACDDGNADNTDGCVANCKLASCGDGHVYTGVEECDDANADNTDACVKDCKKAKCGDGYVQAGVEECDDGNTNDTDACPNACTSPWTTATWTACGQTSASGPSQSQCDTAYAGSLLEGKITVTGGYQYWVVPLTATYRIEVWGAEGGKHNFGAGGRGARMRGDFALAAGTKLKILVGQKGKDGSSYDVGGGGGTFVAKDDNSPLIVAGGGGAAGNCGGGWSQSGQDGKAAIGNGAGGASCNQGGYCGCGGAGSGGAGFTGNGGGDGAGKSFVNGGTGATGVRPGQCVNAGWGGFGGGGNGGNGGGGGGGYQGGDGGCGSPVYGGGGLSYNAGANASNSDGVQTGAGKVVITKL